MVKTPTPIRGCGPVISALDPWARRIRRSDRLGRMGRGGLDSARQVVVSRRSVNGDTTEREGREQRHSKRERDTERNSNGVGKTVCLHVVFSSARQD